MEKCKLWLIVIVGLLLLAPVGAFATTYTQTIMDSTLVIPYQGTSSTTAYNGGNPLDIIASNTSLWDIKQVAVTWDTVANTVEMKIYTNYQPTGQEGAGQGDIALRLHSTDPTAFWTYGISMAGFNSSNTPLNTPFATSVVSVSEWLTTTQILNPPWSGGGYYYAGAYVSSTGNQPIDSVIKTSGSPLTSVDGKYSLSDNTLLSTYMLDLVFNWSGTGFNFTSFDFLVKSGTCGNETMFGAATFDGTIPTPIPPSALLLGSGLLGLVGLGWRRRRQSS